MKRFVIFALLIAFCVAGTAPSRAQQISPQENARRSRREIKQQQKMLNRANKRQAKAMRKAAKAQQKAMRKANRRHRR